MLIKLDKIQPIIFKKLEEINSFKGSGDSHCYLHGSSSKKQNSLVYATDIDTEYWIKMTDTNKREAYEHCINVIKWIMSKGDMYFVKLRCGYDPRFDLGIEIKKNGSIIGYDHKKISKRLKAITTKEEFALLDIPKEPVGLEQVELFKLRVDELAIIQWTYDEVVSGTKEYREKTFSLYDDFFTKSPLLFAFVWEFSKGEYILFDFSIKLIKMKKGYENFAFSDDYSQYETMLKNGTVIDDFGGRRTNVNLYYGIFKNFAQNKYLKTLKRTRTLITALLYDKIGYDEYNNSNSELKLDYDARDLLVRARKQIGDVTSKVEYSCMSQLKNKCDIIIFFIDIKPIMEIKKMVVDLLKDSISECKYDNKEDIKRIYDVIGAKSVDANKLVDALLMYKKNMFNMLNADALPALLKVYKEIGPLLPFKLNM